MNGLAGLYKGLSISVIRDVPGWAVYFATYDKLKQYDDSFAWKCNAGGLAGAISWFICIP